MARDNQVVLVTGGTRGIGRAISLRLARERPRAMVVAYCLNHEAARNTVTEIEAMGVEASAIVTDVGDPAMLERLFVEIDQRYGRLDVLVSNAARTTFRPILDLSVRSWNRVLELNAQAFLVASQLAVPLMKKTGGGRIVGLSSLGSQRCAPDYSALGASKAAMESLARYLACELGSMNISVNVVSGGFIDTETMRMHPEYPRLVESVLAKTPAGRLGTPDDIAEVVAFLCGRGGEWIRGQTLIADGGFSLAL